MVGKENKQFFPVMPLINTVVFPKVAVPLAVGRPQSLAALDMIEPSRDGERRMLVIAQKNTAAKQPVWDDMQNIGTIVIIKRIEKLQGGSLQVVVQGEARMRIQTRRMCKSCMIACGEILPNPNQKTLKTRALVQENQKLALKIASIMDPEHGIQHYGRLISSIEDPLLQNYRLVSLANLGVEEQQSILEQNNLSKLLEQVRAVLIREHQIAKVRIEIASQTKSDLEQQQREAVLRQQKRAIESALGEQDSEQDDRQELKFRLEAVTVMPKKVRAEAEREIKRMERLQPSTSDFQVARTYVELILELPWSETTETIKDLNITESALNEDHFGLESVKEHILEHISVMQLNDAAKAPILCLVGPPGVGKTSLGRSIARSLGRKFEHISLGGMHDEAELRGHRRTYVGAMPGRIIQAIRRTGVMNPVIMLDELDKLLDDGHRGYPSAVLMEILDPAQNVSFQDNYLNLPYDLSNVFFIATANSLDTISRPLLDRMEVIELSGYTEVEKKAIAERYLIPRQMKDAGLTPRQLAFKDNAMNELIRCYTRESGVRELNRSIGRIARKQSRRVLEKKPVRQITTKHLPNYLGPKKYLTAQTDEQPLVGVASGLGWTEMGGEIIKVEAVLMDKKQSLLLTGRLGDVMKESAYAARSYIWSRACDFGLDLEQIQDAGVHIHLPAGGIPKDGPSAGVTMATALLSVYSGRPVRSDIAMTGEITLTGGIIAVGGIKEKVLAAHRSGYKHIILPKQNRKDEELLPSEVVDEVQLIYVSDLKTVFRKAVIGFKTKLRTKVD